MNEREKIKEQSCGTSERGGVLISKEEMVKIKADIGKRIVEAFSYQPDAEIACILKTKCAIVKSVTEGEELPSTEMLLCIHKATGFSIHWILTGEITKHTNFTEFYVVSDEAALCGLA